MNNTETNGTMKVTKIYTGCYKVVDNKGTFIIKGGAQTVTGEWVAFETDSPSNTTDENSWGVQFKTKKELIDYSQSF
jgi:hypothetical protein